MSRTIFLLAPSLALCSLSGIANPAPAETVIDVGSKKQLFIDSVPELSLRHPGTKTAGAAAFLSPGGGAIS